MTFLFGVFIFWVGSMFGFLIAALFAISGED